MPRKKPGFKNKDGIELAGMLELPESNVLSYALFAHCFTCTKDNIAASRISRSLAARSSSGNRRVRRTNSMKMTYTIRSLLVFLACLTVPQMAAAEDENRYLSLAAGHVAVLDDNISDPLVYKLEYRFRPKTKWQLAPSIGIARSENDASFVFADLARDFYLSEHWVMTASFGLGTFDDGRDVKLGNDLEFRSGLRIGYQFRNDMRLALEFFHLSNGGLSDRNPGTEPMFLSLFFSL